MKKDIKKSSYYVWFLGAEEAKGLRGSEYMIPVIRNLVEREKQIEPFKVTLQVSHKGLKIIQNVPTATPPTAGLNGLAATTKSSSANKIASGKTEVIKHFIPHHAVTSVFQSDDIVACILLLYNPITKCPVHVHCYRCDSVETAEILCGQLQILLERPENQKKLDEIESRLRAKGLVVGAPSSTSHHHSRSFRKVQQQSCCSSSPSDGGRSSSARDSDLSAGSSGGSDRLSAGGAITTTGPANEARIANLYDSLAAELKEKLNVAAQQKQAPLLLPPRDYDTVHRQKGNLSGIDFRRCLNMNIVGVNAAAAAVAKNNNKQRQSTAVSQSRLAGCSAATKLPAASATTTPMAPRPKLGSSGGSSGIGSDHAPSPDQECDTRFLDNQSSSDEEWNINEQVNGNSLFLVQPSCATNDWKSKELSLPRARRHNSSGFESAPSGGSCGKIGPPQDDAVFYKRADDEFLLEYKNGKKQYHRQSSSSSDFERKSKFSNDSKAQKPSKFVSSPSDNNGKSDDTNGNNKKRTPEDRQRSPSPAEVISPKERFKDAKEKFLLLEKERLEEQEKLIQKNLEKRKLLMSSSGHHQERFNRSSSKNWSSRDDDFDDTRIRYASTAAGSANMYHYQQQQQQQDDYNSGMDVDSKRRSIAKANYHRNRSMESLNSEDYPSLISSANNSNNNNGCYRSSENMMMASGQSPRSKMNSFPEEDEHEQDGVRWRKEYSRMSRYHNSETEDHHHNAAVVASRRRYAADSNSPPVNHNSRPVPRSYSEDYLPDHPNTNQQRYNYQQQSLSVPFEDNVNNANVSGNPNIPLQRYRSPTRLTGDNGGRTRTYNYPGPMIHQPEEENVRRVKRSDSRYYSRPVPVSSSEMELNRRGLENVEDEKRRNSNEIAKELLKRRSYQEHPHATSRTASSESSYRGANNAVGAGYHEIEERDTYNVQNANGKLLTRVGRPSSPTQNGPNSISPRYRHSYAEPFHHHAVGPISHNHDLLHRTSSSLSSGRIGIAAVHQY